MFGKRKGTDRERIRERSEDLLKAVAHGRDLEGSWDPAGMLPGVSGAQLDRIMERLEQEELAEWRDGGWRLTAAGRRRALELLRAHRLMETWLSRQRGRPAKEVHAEADKAEHLLTPAGMDELADLMKRPRFDPHGDPIPERRHDLHHPQQKHLKDMAEGSAALVAHIEDEPESDYLELQHMGLAVELPVRILKQEHGSTRIELAGEQLELPTRLAAHIEVVPFPEDRPFPDHLRRLSSLKQGESGLVEFISPACMGPERRRLLDFGMVPGSEVTCEFASPFQSPIAYRVRGTTIGLRNSQAMEIFIRKPS